jgi:hypothetical protein
MNTLCEDHVSPFCVGGLVPFVRFSGNSAHRTRAISVKIGSLAVILYTGELNDFQCVRYTFVDGCGPNST